MAHRPILRPDDSESSALSTTSRAGQTEDEKVYRLSELANTFVAQGAGIISADLALDLVLNDIVKQACLATGASGAAVALLRDGEMVCRASSGAAAPDLGMRLDTRSGLAGAAVQSGELQLCPNTGSDPRVDARTCRRCGILSILVLPLMEEGEVFGIFEVLSPQLNAFGELDVLTIKALAQQIVQNRRQAHKTADMLETGTFQFPAALSEKKSDSDLTVVPVAEQSRLPDETIAPPLVGALLSPASRGSDFWTSFLAVLVIATAVLMATLIGWRLGWRKAAAAHRNRPGRHTAVVQPTIAPSAPNSITPSALDPKEFASEASARHTAEPQTPSNPARKRIVPRPAATSEPPTGGLVIYQGGKLIYRQLPSKPEENIRASNSGKGVPAGQQLSDVLTPAGESGSVQVSEEIAKAHLVKRVEPQYPADARQQHVEGTVVLDAQISREGSVQSVNVIEGDRQLAEAAVHAVKQWRYRPYRVNGQPVEMQTRITVNFRPPAE